MRVPLSLHPHQHLLLSFSFNYSRPTPAQCYPIVVGWLLFIHLLIGSQPARAEWDHHSHIAQFVPFTEEATQMMGEERTNPRLVTVITKRDNNRTYSSVKKKEKKRKRKKSLNGVIL